MITVLNWIFGIALVLFILNLIYRIHKTHTIEHWCYTLEYKHWWGKSIYYVILDLYKNEPTVSKIAVMNKKDDTPDEVTIDITIPDDGLKAEWSDLLYAMELDAYRPDVYEDGVYTDMSKVKKNVRLQCEQKDLTFFQDNGYKVTRQVDDHLYELEKEVTSKNFA